MEKICIPKEWAKNKLYFTVMMSRIYKFLIFAERYSVLPIHSHNLCGFLWLANWNRNVYWVIYSDTFLCLNRQSVDQQAWCKNRLLFGGWMIFFAGASIDTLQIFILIYLFLTGHQEGRVPLPSTEGDKIVSQPWEDFSNNF